MEVENRPGEGKNSVGNVEAKELISMTHGYELSGGNVGRTGWAGWSGVKGRKWDNCNSIINKYIFKNCQGRPFKQSSLRQIRYFLFLCGCNIFQIQIAQ